MKRAIATPPGEPTRYVDLTEKELNELITQQNAPPPPEPFQHRMQKAFEALPVEKQERFADDILKAAFFLERGNMPMVAIAIKQAGWKVQPEDADVKAIIDAAKKEMGVE